MTKKSGESKGCGFIEFGDKASYWVSEITSTVWRPSNVLHVNNDYIMIYISNLNIYYIMIYAVTSVVLIG